jgi:hypothetical protein
MPSVAEAIQSAQQFKNQTPVSPMQPIGAPATDKSLEPIRSPFMRCPLPVLWNDSSDSNRALYMGAKVPQFRVFTPVTATPNNALGEVGTTTTTGSGGGGSSGGGSSKQPTAQSASITSGPLNPGQTFVSTMQVAKSFTLLGITTSGPARVQLYGTQQAQSSDAYRGLDVPPPAGTLQGLICDVALDTAPYNWEFQDRVGANSNTPQTSAIYVTLTNIGSASETVTLTLVYVPLES